MRDCSCNVTMIFECSASLVLLYRMNQHCVHCGA